MNTTATKFLASVSNLDEARLVAAHGADIIDLKNPANGALGAVSRDELCRIVTALQNRYILSATIGDRPLQAMDIAEAVATTAATGVDIVKVGWFGKHLDNEVLASLQEAAGQWVTLVIVMFAEYGIQTDYLSAFARAGIHGVMLDTADKQTGSLRDKLDDAELLLFIRQARECGLFCGLAGSLQRADIIPLKRLQPDYLGFRGALCPANQRIAAIDEAAVESVRLLMHTDIHAQANTHGVICA